MEPLEVPVARAVVDKLIGSATELTTGQLRARLRRLVIAADPRTASDRARQKTAGRRVEVFVTEDHLGGLAGHDLAPHRVAAGWERLTAIAKAAKAAGDPRRVPWAQGGPTHPDNFAPTCRRDHTFKHAPGTQLVQLGSGAFAWSTPRGM